MMFNRSLLAGTVILQWVYQSAPQYQGTDQGVGHLKGCRIPSLKRSLSKMSHTAPLDILIHNLGSWLRHPK